MNGYFQIPIKKLKVLKHKVLLQINGVHYEYIPTEKYLIKIILNAEYELSQVLIGFMIKDGKVISNDDLQIIINRIKNVFPNSNLIQEEPKKRKGNNPMNSKSGKQPIEELSKSKVGKSVRNSIKLTHRFRTLEISIDKLIFKKDLITVRYGDFEFEEVAIGSISQYNNLKKRKEIKLLKIPIKLNYEIIIIDDKTKGDLLNQFSNAKKRFDLEQNLLSKKLNINEEKKKVTPTLSTKASNEKTNEHKTSINVRKIELDEEHKFEESSNWNFISFYNGKFSYKGKWFYANKSKAYLNHLKPFFSRKSLTYTINKSRNEISGIIIPNEVYDLVKLGKQVDDILNIKRSGKILNLGINLNNYGITFYDVLSIFGKSKSFYLEYLFDKQILDYEIICIPEPIYQNGELVKRDISFIFMIGNIVNPTVIWESVEPNKASYMFDVDAVNYNTRKVINTIQTFLLIEEPYKRSILRRSLENFIEGVNEIKFLRHEYFIERDFQWVYNIEAHIRKNQ